MDALQASVAAAGHVLPVRDVSDPAKNWDATLRLIAKMPTVVAAFHRIRRGEEILEPRTTSITPPTSTTCSSARSRRRRSARCSTPA